MLRFLYFLVVFFLVRLAWNAVAQWALDEARRQLGQPEPGQPKPIHRGHMVRDPVCGLHLPESRAVTASLEDGTVHFCSERCRDSFQAAHA